MRLGGRGHLRRMESRPVVVAERAVPLEQWSDDRGQIGFRTLFGDGERPTDTLTAGTAELEPGGWLRHHRHGPAEVYYVLEGEGAVVLDGEERVVGVGDAVFVPGGAEHAVRNTGDGRFRVFYTLAADRFSDVAYHFSDRPGAR